MKKTQLHWTIWLKAAIWLVCLLPAGRLGYGLWSDLTQASLLLTANPVEFIIRQTGYWGLVFLLAGLAVSPLNRLSVLSGIVRVRRLIGLFAFFYLCLHLCVYVWLEQGLNISEVIHDIIQRPFILFGMSGWLILLPLALTSNLKSQKLLGGKRWKQLHKGAYIAPLLGILHYYWLVKIDHHLPWLFAGTVTLLLLVRTRFPKRRQQA